MFDTELFAKSEQLIATARAAGKKIATAESCTGGLLAGLLSHIPGSSDVLERGFVTYSNASKIELLGVEARLIDDHGAVSPHVAKAMAAGALAHSRADIALSITGIAGPGGGSAGKPVGLVYLGCAVRGDTALISKQNFGDIGRENVRRASLMEALEKLQVAVHQAMGRP